MKKNEGQKIDLKTQKSTKTRAGILEAALRRFSSSGYSATSIQDIADEAELTKPTLYYYFNSKADLFSVLVEQALVESTAILQKIIVDGGNVREILINILLSMSKRAEEKRSVMRLIHYSFFAAEKEIPYREKCFDEASKAFSTLEKFFKTRIDNGSFKTNATPADITLAIVGIMNAVTTTQLVKKEPAISHKRAEMIIDIFLDGSGKCV